MVHEDKSGQRDPLVQAAEDVRKNAYAPYSKFHVAASFEMSDGRIFSGVNVENCSYGLTVCAERNAIANAVVEGAKPGDFVSAEVLCERLHITAPCGACRQVMAEFMDPEAPVILMNARDGAMAEVKMRELLSTPFTRLDLEQSTQESA